MFYSPMTPPPPTSTLFPYTTLFRSIPSHQAIRLKRSTASSSAFLCPAVRSKPGNADMPLAEGSTSKPNSRSEEHTSELQSQSNLVCRLLLEKKKKHHPETAC